MRLLDMGRPFGALPPEEQEEFIRALRARRAEALRKPKKISRRASPSLSPEEKEVLKALGLSLRALRRLANETDEEASDQS